ncbi:MAG: periplasmic heavy metal sensor [Candidatus Auribacter fodinae]|uniref:Periplasmic heavy metal sensor n=1 Tax=Candidatus Auribacter fodinae TaxID=2093366 RepID=A0A3A4R9W6_9BACT|nr:MAG: periplasmic heavy metal sensor [Candidatus Auribacter fodinae]
MKLRTLSIWMISALLLSAAEFAPAQDFCDEKGPGGYGKRHGKMKDDIEEIMRELDLSDEQTARLAEMRKQGQEQKQALYEKKRELHKQIKNELDKPESDQTALNTLADELASVQKQLITDRINSVLEMKKVLTPEQYAALKYKMDVKHEARKELRKMRHERRRHMAPPDEEPDAPEAPEPGDME